MVCSLLGGSFSLKEVMSLQLSSQDLLSESSPLSESPSLRKQQRKKPNGSQKKGEIKMRNQREDEKMALKKNEGMNMQHGNFNNEKAEV